MANFITSEKIHNGQNWLPAGTVIELNDDGLIIALHENYKSEHVKCYEGILCPGFVNVHCHLELSHTKGLIPEHTGLIPFLQQVMQHRFSFSEEQKKIARHEAFEEMLKDGVVAVGDICNTTETLDLRALDKIHVHSFSEAIGITETRAQQSFEAAKQVCKAFAAQPNQNCILNQSIAPHAPYSVSAGLFDLINEYNSDSLVCIHNQESEEENKFYENKSGKVNDLLKGFKIDTSEFQPSGKTSLHSYLPHFQNLHPFIFVHNTYTNKQDAEFAEKQMPSAFWCLCPNANLYIENRLPDVKMLRKNDVVICLGTDSLASNHQLSIFSEMKTLKKYFCNLDWEELIVWATYNGAKALQMDNIIGTIEPGKKPGILQIKNMDAENASCTRVI